MLTETLDRYVDGEVSLIQACQALIENGYTLKEIADEMETTAEDLFDDVVNEGFGLVCALSPNTGL